MSVYEGSDLSSLVKILESERATLSQSEQARSRIARAAAHTSWEGSESASISTQTKNLTPDPLLSMFNQVGSPLSISAL